MIVILYIRGQQIARVRVALLLNSIRALRSRARFDRALAVQMALLLALSAITMAAVLVLLTRLTRLRSRVLSRLWQVDVREVDVVDGLVGGAVGSSLESSSNSTVVLFSIMVSWAWPRPLSSVWKLNNAFLFCRPTVHLFCWACLI